MAKTQQDIYQTITDRILAALDAGTVPWRKTWIGCRGSMNGVTGNYYRGINALSLFGLTEFEYPIFAGFSQWKKLTNSDGDKGSVLKGSKGIPVYKAVCFHWINNSDGTTSKLKSDDDIDGDNVRHKTILKYVGNVFNIEQTNLELCDLPESVQDHIGSNMKRSEFERILEAEQVISDYVESSGIGYVHEQQTAYYSPGLDLVNIPKPNTFEKTGYYYRTAFHELTHSTGHSKRLGRLDALMTGVAAFGDDDYSKEELVAEIGSAMLCGIIGIYDSVIDVSASYIDSWRKVLGDDPRIVVQAAGKAQVAVDYIQGIK